MTAGTPSPTHKNTANARGCMHPLSPFSQEFITYSSNKVVADIGCAYGVVTLAALKAGAKQVTACDMEPKHLEAVIAATQSTSYKSKLSTQCGTLPQGFQFDPQSLDGLYCSHVLEYLTGVEIENLLKRCYDWLKPGGKIFIRTYTVFMRELDNAVFNEHYHNEKTKGNPWPGYLENYDHYCVEDVDAQETAVSTAEFPANLHLFELVILTQALTNVGFTIDTATYLDGKTQGAVAETWHQGKELLGIIATKTP